MAILRTRLTSLIRRLRITRPRGPGPELPHWDLARSEFDSAFYMETYPDVREARLDPFSHYMRQGWIEGRNPSEKFDTNRYLDLNRDVRDAGVNPLLHYALCGRVEGRALEPPRESDPAVAVPVNQDDLREFCADPGTPESLEESVAPTSELLNLLLEPDDPRKIIELAQPPSELAREWLLEVGPPTLLSDTLTDRLVEASVGARGLAISISHDDYIVSVGGTQNIIGDEERALARGEVRYLHLCPMQPLPMLAPPDSADLLMHVRLGSEKLGVARFSDILTALVNARRFWQSCSVIIHQLLGHRPEDVAELTASLRPDGVFAYLHDFLALCTSYNLLRNDVSYCNAPDPSSGSCLVCCHGPERSQHLARMDAFFAETRPTLCIYSDSAQEVWSNRNPFGTLETLRICLAYVDLHRSVMPRTAVLEGHAPLRIGFLGTPNHLKGWNVFANLAKEFEGDLRYEFLQLSTREKSSRNIAYIPVSVRPDDRLAMVRALREEEIDVALIWSIWPETFCFTAYEAMAAGTFVVTFSGSGNAGRGVQAQGPRQGICLDSVSDLRDLFVTGDIISLTCAPGRKSGELIIQAPLAQHILEQERRLAHV